jgi:hypothetical protein
MPLLSAPQFSSAPISGQLAKAGEWEQAWSFSSNEVPTDLAVAAFLNQSREVAFEAFFGLAFFGARCVGEPQKVEFFAVKCVQALRGSSSSPFLAAMNEQFGCPRRGAIASYAEIGCVNAWRSAGTLRLSNLHTALAKFEETWLTTQQSLPYRSAQYRKAIEFAFEQPMPHWFGLPISEPEPPYAISKEMLRDALRLCEPAADEASAKIAP